MARSFLRILLWTTAVIAALVIGLVIYLRSADLSAYEEQIEKFVAERTDYELDIAGRFVLEVGRLTRLTAEAVTLSEQGQVSAAPLAQLGHFTIVVDTWSLFGDTFVIEELLIRDVSANLAPSEEEGVASEGVAAEVDTDRLAVRRVEIEAVDLTWRDPARPQPIRFVLESLTVTPGADDILDLYLEGAINELPLAAQGELGPWPNLIDGRDISADLEMGLGQLSLSIVGSAADVVNLNGISAVADIQGPEVALIIERLGLPPFASGAFDLEARVEPRDDGHELRAAGHLGEIKVFVSGTMDDLVETEHADLDFTLSGPDTQHVAELFGVAGAPAEPFSIEGGLSLDGPLIAIDAVNASVGANKFEADGAITIGRQSDNVARLRAQGPDFSAFRDLTGLEGLPERPFDISARLRSDSRGIAVEEATGVLGENRLDVDGIVTDEPGLVGTALRIGAAGPELRQVAVLAGVPHLPAGAFDIDVQVEIDRELIRFGEARAQVGELVMSGSGQLGSGSRAGFVEVTASLRAPDAAQFTAVPYLQPFAGEPFSFTGGFRKSGDKLEVSEVLVDIGDWHGEVDGMLSLSPKSNASDLRFLLRGSSVERLVQMFGGESQVDKSFESSGQFTGTPTGFAMRDFVVRVGESDIEGNFETDFTEKPRISGKLTSEHLDLRDQLESLVGEEDPAAEVRDMNAAEPGAAEFVFSDQPLEGRWLNAADLDIELQLAHLKTNTLDVSDFQMGFKLEDGALSIEPIRMTEREGKVLGSVSLVPVDDGYALDAIFEASQLHLGFTSTDVQDHTALPMVDGRMAIRGVGKSLHEIASAASGNVSFRQGPGEVEEFVAAILFKDVVLEALRTINPLRKESDSRRLDCGIYEISIAEGVATFDRVAMQTNQLLIVVTGNMDLETEKLNINFRAKPRQGIGVSLGTLANSFLGVRGTLASPAVTLDPAGSMTATGAAMATGGLSLLARGLWDRLAAEKSICGQQPTPDTDTQEQ